MSSKCVKRITLFKVPKEEDIDAILAEYQVMRTSAQKDGKPYILSNEATRVLNSSEERSQGYTLVAVTTFKSREDVEYYDKGCAAHKKLREFITPRRTGFATIHYESELGP
ncbi:uncharacterized protein Z519_05556 [Cladophialophora bantiana CBS 173.52]|uniref:Stress-response A/B barrel domain-containing protein n=1 Tax=Cladophialophora bantiana (strain ATCC 10958 / CBS 173.52 / CDC B-1940 / NIH 8579) TaxID=1442370 RepID=A0A0D2HTQ9_CLAB1|nr:uncharacterized protein Z519_05556 [Cladophialophora bantiana CBS 173.52]KIW94240.1 hypothetical protein Z519_05556 [Cladophialophora bantiana CBS 173.52]